MTRSPDLDLKLLSLGTGDEQEGSQSEGWQAELGEAISDAYEV